MQGLLKQYSNTQRDVLATDENRIQPQSATSSTYEDGVEDHIHSTQLEKRFSMEQPQVNFASGSTFSGENT